MIILIQIYGSTNSYLSLATISMQKNQSVPETKLLWVEYRTLFFFCASTTIAHKHWIILLQYKSD